MEFRLSTGPAASSWAATNFGVMVEICGIGGRITMLQRSNILVALSAILAGLLFQPVGLRAQSGAGSIQGTIQDATGAAVPACTVHVVNQKTGVTTDTTSNEVGFYSVPGLFAGSYTITFSAAGMKKYEASLTLQNS